MIEKKRNETRPEPDVRDFEINIKVRYRKLIKLIKNNEKKKHRATTTTKNWMFMTFAKMSPLSDLRIKISKFHLINIEVDFELYLLFLLLYDSGHFYFSFYWPVFPRYALELLVCFIRWMTFTKTLYCSSCYHVWDDMVL